MDTIINYIYSFFRNMKQSTFYILMGVTAFLAFYIFSLFLKANKKDSTKILKVSYLLMTIFLIILIVAFTRFRY